jgi:hypothetical protein
MWGLKLAMSTLTIWWRRLRASFRGPSFADIAAAADGELDPEFYKRTRVMMPNVAVPTTRGKRRNDDVAPTTPRIAPNVTVAQRGERFLLGWADSYFGIWDAWVPAEPIRRYTQDPDGWNQAWSEFSELEPATAVRARGSWPSSVNVIRHDALVS